MKQPFQTRLLAVLLCVAAVTKAPGQGTAFTYQGRLHADATPANGLYELQFSLYDAVTNGNQVGTTVSVAPVPVSNGLFNVPLDFGAVAFDGASRWLEITVTPHGSDQPPVTLSPRQPLTATPYAIRAANFSGTVADTQLSANVARLNADQTFSGPVQFANPSNTFAGTFTGNGAGVTNVNLGTIKSGGAIDLAPGATFFLSSSLAVGHAPGSPVAVDVNADGHRDLITANAFDDTLSVLTNDGQGQFTLFCSPSVGGDGKGLLTTADVNGDGHPDVVTVREALFECCPARLVNTLSILTNDGSGNFLLATSPLAALNSVVYDITAADVNGDEHADLITANVRGHDSTGTEVFGTLSVLTNDGRGIFSLSSFPDVGGSPFAVTAADVNGDGHYDLISANFHNRTVSVLINNQRGQFTLTSSPNVGQYPKDLAAADVNGDGHIDLISADFGDNRLSVLTNDGSGGFSLSLSPGVGGPPSAVAAADVNGDGHSDLISVISTLAGTLSVLTNNGMGGFTIASSPYAGVERSSIAAVDVNGDTYIDLISGSAYADTVSVLLNSPFSFRGTFSGNLSGNFAGGLNATNLTGTVPEAALASVSSIGGVLRWEHVSRSYTDVPCETWGEEYSINLIAGLEQNFVAQGVIGATISGGGLARNACDSFWFVNVVSADFGTVSGGLGNTSSGYAATITGGSGNTSGGNYATVSGGAANTASSSQATVGGGGGNTSSGSAATVSGGERNISSNAYATVPGGYLNIAGGAYSFAAGRRAQALHDGAFVWGDSTDADIASTATNQFTVRAAGGVRFVLGPEASGAELAPGSGAWSTLSDRNAKENFAPANAREILDKVAALPLATWNNKAQDASIRHIGPTAQDFHAAFGVGENDRTITTVDADGVALAAIQGLNQKLEEKAARLDALEKELAGLKELIRQLSTNSK